MRRLLYTLLAGAALGGCGDDAPSGRILPPYWAEARATPPRADDLAPAYGLLGYWALCEDAACRAPDREGLVFRADGVFQETTLVPRLDPRGDVRWLACTTESPPFRWRLLPSGAHERVVVEAPSGYATLTLELVWLEPNQAFMLRAEFGNAARFFRVPVDEDLGECDAQIVPL